MSGAQVALLSALAMAADPSLAAGAGTPAASPADRIPDRVSVRVLEKLHPASLTLSDGARAHRASVSGGRLLVDGAPVAAPYALPPGRWSITAAGAPARTYDGGVELAPAGREVAIVVWMGLEDHVAAAVAAESGPDTPREALRALAIVIRSFAASARGRHGAADLCDLAHCQVMAGRRAGRHAEAAREAARSTEGKVLRLASGRVAEAAFHAACGGHTADPVQAFGGAATGSVAVPDPGCPREEWRAVVPETALARTLSRLLPRGADAGGGAGAGDLHLRRGAGGRVVQVGDGSSWVGGEAFARGLDRELGHGRVRSAHFEVRKGVAGVELVGQGNGHGVGLCQAGAALRASRGDDHAAILAHYFPLARPDGAPGVTVLGAGPTAPRWAPLNRTSSR